MVCLTRAVIRGVFNEGCHSWCVQQGLSFMVCSTRAIIHGLFNKGYHSWCVQQLASGPEAQAAEGWGLEF
eukprot:4651190-Pyramimonas_sp.AAC.2